MLDRIRAYEVRCGINPKVAPSSSQSGQDMRLLEISSEFKYISVALKLIELDFSFT